MNLNKLNELFSDFKKLRKSGYKQSTEVIRAIQDEGIMGDEGISYEIYQIPNFEFLIKLKIVTDSYGNNESVAGIEFGISVEKVIKGFEPIK